ncbi:MAG: DUF4160 domain-containing protein [Moritella sp.]|uniref:DUF4160 domain-containing protein n=1 Tax=Moritella sp. TaxID=78556 RepID=UPI0029A3D34A|nr:DUF4160 domain-containing protein [Moritella sp.]MDX2319039.1 DUF4160 domain-containing protein [Moritella sp.]
MVSSTIFLGLSTQVGHPNKVKTPHVLAQYKERNCRVAIADGSVISGVIPFKQLYELQQWIGVNYHRLQLEWNNLT